ncbi:DUF998 domain-containing protein [Nonomuraea sp. NPDC050556]|uniref:DUF998 domain-containing protein n=1 Tax=Nonomuraea sp. NPDC050556 TaxID=3364369 RepID=UPI0037A9FD41
MAERSYGRAVVSLMDRMADRPDGRWAWGRAWGRWRGGLVGCLAVLRGVVDSLALLREHRLSNAKEALVLRNLLRCGAVAGPFFLGAVLVQDYTRPGFNPRVHPLSLLSLGGWGWVQVVTFVVAGLLFVAGGVGLADRW